PGAQALDWQVIAAAVKKTAPSGAVSVCGLPQTLKRATRLLRSIARRDSSWLAALVWLAPAEVCIDRSRMLTRLRSTSRATCACSSEALAITRLRSLIEEIAC